MLYSDKDCILLSIIFSKIKEDGYSKQIIDLKALYYLFKASIEDRLNIFTIDLKQLEFLIEKAVSN